MISAHNIYKSFGKQQVLRGINLEIEKGKTTTIVGPSGVGKSVFLKLVMGILEPDEGTIFVNGQEITAAESEAEKNAIRRSLGVLFQSAALFDSLTVYENVAFPMVERGGMAKSEIRDRADQMLAALSLTRQATCYPEQISIGMRKRVGMARALVTEPSILLVDEPNTGLDPMVGQEVYDLINHCRENWNFTAVVISHELPEVFQVSDRVAMLLNAKLIFEGTPEEFMSSDDPAVQQFLHGRIDGPIKIQ